jgi:predicted nucleotidyltransferase
LQTRKFYSTLAERVAQLEKSFSEFVQALCSSELVEEAYLVGSRARGDHVPSSDFDVVVIVREHVDPLEAAVQIRLLSKKSIPLDLVVLYRSDLADPIYRKMLEGSKKLC